MSARWLLVKNKAHLDLEFPGVRAATCGAPLIGAVPVPEGATPVVCARCRAVAHGDAPGAVDAKVIPLRRASKESER